MKLVSNKVVMVAIVAVAMLSACKRETADDDTAPATNFAASNSIFSEAQNIADDAAENGSISFKTDDATGFLSGCATITHDTASSPKLLTIDFGSSGCVGADGKLRKGKITISYSGKYKAPGTVKTFSFDNYSVNGNQISNSSSKTVTNNGYNSANHLTWSIAVNGAVTLANGNGTVTWTSSRTREMLAGEGTPQLADDKYSITGSSSGTTAAGLAFTATIDDANPLVRDLSCAQGKRNFTAGKVTITITGKLPRVIDFGSGACDNEATVTIGSKTKTIIL
ncbi:MAG: hypothetical protein KF872_10750 [Chitinophagales bacterium]|nr:hypothetical protein [Chitinophagales bacterium]